MSVQAGIWTFDGQPVDRQFLSEISRKLEDYGPDGESTFFDHLVGILYRPFHTTAESRLEHQPYISAGRKVITWDGRLDNREELLSQLMHVLHDDKTDVAIVAAAFEQWGAACFAKLVGDWGVAIWDSSERQLTLARDYIGVRHLFYYKNAKRVIWCNHLSPLALCGDKFTLCEQYVAGFLASWPASHLTPYCEIHSVPSGHFVRIRAGNSSAYPYWSFEPHSTTRYATDSEYEENFRYLFRQSVRRRLQTDSRILAELSGGLDSSSIVCMADDIIMREGRDSSSVDTFSSYDPEEPEEDDFLYFTKVEEKRGRAGHRAELKSSGDSFLFDYPTFMASPDLSAREEIKKVKSRVIEDGKYRVLLSGIGGDQMLGTDRDPRTQMADLLAGFKLLQLGKLLWAWSLEVRRPWIQLLSQSFVILMPISIRTRMRSVIQSEPWLNTHFARRYGITDHVLPAAEGNWWWRPTVRDSFQILRTLSGTMTNVTPPVVDKRYPFLDQTLTKFLTSIPFDQLLRPGVRRSLLRRALVNVLPKEILLRETKASSGRCDVLCFKKHWNVVERLLLAPVTSGLGYVHAARFEAALLAVKNGRFPRHLVQLYRALSLELWLRHALERGVISIPRLVASQAAEHADATDLYAHPQRHDLT